jgi:hypothetical protein
MKSRELYEEYFTLKNFKKEYNKNNKLYDMLYHNHLEILLVSFARRIQSMRGTKELKFVEYLTAEKVQHVKNLIRAANPITFIGDNIKIDFEEL